MKVLIVDDEPLARTRLLRLFAAHSEHTVVGVAEDAGSALDLTLQLQPDLVLLDIAMPGKNGLQLAAELLQFEPPPAVVMVTAHPEHALAAYQVAAVDYLLKPVSAMQLSTMLQRIGLTTKAHLEKQQSKQYISYRQGAGLQRLALETLWFLQAEDKYVRLVFASGEAWSEQSLKHFEEQFPTALCRIHRHTLVLKQRMKAMHLTEDGRHVLELVGCPLRLDISRREVKKIRQLLQQDIAI